MKRVVRIAPLDGVKNVAELENVREGAGIVHPLHPMVGVSLFLGSLSDRVIRIGTGGGGDGVCPAIP